ncbi:uncharacterized protein LOC123611657 [Camelus bactrianus]|uniref:Uncharacterized protein LOC123611657 n=1 Tax=Camelus bactrianus TaxID=9837 RepID=A0A9W3FSU8_CAMBA
MAELIQSISSCSYLGRSSGDRGHCFKRLRKSTRKWARLICCCPPNRVEPINDPTEGLPEDVIEDLSNYNPKDDPVIHNVDWGTKEDGKDDLEDLTEFLIDLPSNRAAEEPPITPRLAWVAKDDALMEIERKDPPEKMGEEETPSTTEVEVLEVDTASTEDLLEYLTGPRISEEETSSTFKMVSDESNTEKIVESTCDTVDEDAAGGNNTQN